MNRICLKVGIRNPEHSETRAKAKITTEAKKLIVGDMLMKHLIGMYVCFFNLTIANYKVNKVVLQQHRSQHFLFQN